MPASRRARAMIFAPRSWPSSPGLAITTRILWVIGAAVYGGADHRRWLQPRVAESRQRPFRVPRRRGSAGSVAGKAGDARPENRDAFGVPGATAAGLRARSARQAEG